MRSPSKLTQWEDERHTPSRAAPASVVAMVTYEIAVPLVAVNIVIYVAAYRNRAAFVRGVVDLGLVVLFVIYRLGIDPAGGQSGFVVHRTVSADLTRAWLLLRTAWGTWRSVYAPSDLVLLAMLITLLAAVVTAVLARARRPALLGWSVILVFAFVASVLCTLTFITANSYYIPASYSTFNRLNLPATVPYALGFVALLGLLYEVLGESRVLRWCAPVVVGVAVVAVGVHQLRVSDTHKGAWETSWKQQQIALAGYRKAVRGLPNDSRILGFGTPEWEQGYVPIFAATWDLRGALDYTTHVDPPAAAPFAGGAVCAPTGVTVYGVMEMPYAGSTPLFAVSSVLDEAVPVGSQAACQQVVDRWGTSPFWGATGPG